MNRSLRVFSGVVTLALAAGLAGATAEGPDDQPVSVSDSVAATFAGRKAVTRASRDSTMSFTFPVEIGEILVKGGQKVKKGDMLVKGVDGEYRFQRDNQKLIADSDLDVQKAKVMMDQAKVEFDAQERLKDTKHAGQEIEWARAKTTLEEKKVEYEIAKLQWQQQKIQLSIREAQLDRLYLKAPFDGTIDNVGTDVGEVKRETEPVLKIVATDPLWMDVNASTPQTILLGLKPGDKAWVLLDLPGQPSVYEGKVIEIAAEANFEANERRVRVELPNPQDWPAGIAAWVRFTPPDGEWAKRVTKTGEKRASVDPRQGAELAAHSR